MWKDSKFIGDGPTHSAQMVVDGVSYLSETVCNISAQPSKALTEFIADWAAPSYWKPNAEIFVSKQDTNPWNDKKNSTVFLLNLW